jgi:uncharacterized protein (DUF58 family)
MVATLALTPDSVLRRLEWRVIRRLDGRMQGDYRTLFGGAGIDVRDLRDYEYGDEVRHIDWNVTARMDTPFVREHFEERELTCWMLLDRSPSMRFGAVERPKELVMAELATTLARLFTRGGNRIGAILYNNEVEKVLPARSGRNQVLCLTQALLTPAPNTGTSTNLAGLLTVAMDTIRRRSLVILVSDFISEPGWERSLALLNQRHEVVAIRLVDPREFELPSAGLIVVEDSETGEQLFVDTSNAEFRRRLRTTAVARNVAIRDAAVAAGVDLQYVSTDEDLLHSLVRMIDKRKRVRRR